MGDILLRGLPEEVVRGLDRRAARLGLSRAELIRRGLAALVRPPLAAMPVVHVDEDFELIASVTGQPVERLALP